jgi:hypothetical protein
MEFLALAKDHGIVKQEAQPSLGVG